MKHLFHSRHFAWKAEYTVLKVCSNTQQLLLQLMTLPTSLCCGPHLPWRMPPSIAAFFHLYEEAVHPGGFSQLVKFGGELRSSLSAPTSHQLALQPSECLILKSTEKQPL
jgi:hypothetical protein